MCDARHTPLLHLGICLRCGSAGALPPPLIGRFLPRLGRSLSSGLFLASWSRLGRRNKPALARPRAIGVSPKKSLVKIGEPSHLRRFVRRAEALCLVRRLHSY